MLTWQSFLEQQMQLDSLKETMAFIEQQRAAGKVIYPKSSDVFAAFEHTPLESIKVVILGQDPYHGPNQANGLSFSVSKGVKIPPSLLNIFKELENEYDDFIRPKHGNLQTWARQGVLLLNTVLTVEQGHAHSHKNLAWEAFTDEVIKTIDHERDGIIFLLWGAHAQKKGKIIDRQKHFVLKAPHPSPLSAHRGFFGCNHFAETNELLRKQERSMINWKIID